MPFLRTAFTGRDNLSYDVARILWVLVTGAYMALTVYAMHRGYNFDPVTWCAGDAAINGSFAAAIFFKKDAEPECHDHCDHDEACK